MAPPPTNPRRLDLDSLDPSRFPATLEAGLSSHLRRSLDLAGAALFGVVSAPLWGSLALLVRLVDGGPVLYRQARVGRDGVPFDLLKLRTMDGDEEGGRVTRLGRFLRRSRLDELPQLWNVLRGEMGLVGPRPERPELVARFVEAIPGYDLRHRLRPGITGWAQVHAGDGISVEETREKLAYDLYYLRHRSAALDLRILGRTVPAVLRGLSRRPTNAVDPGEGGPYNTKEP
jgi:lipopolysaccharide/colanic/teichoic acid biosynthesis glycosyltransferase